MIKKHLTQIILIVIILGGLFHRLYGLNRNYSLWTDEISTARFGQMVAQTGFPRFSNGYAENAYYVTHYLTGLSFKLFGVTEFTARLPEVLFGTLVILAVYLLASKVFSKTVGLSASTLTSFSYIQIAWSRQARGYVILEFFVLLALLFLYRFLTKPRLSEVAIFFIFTALAFFTHPLGMSLVPVFIISSLLTDQARKYLFSRPNLPVLLVFICLSIIFLFAVRTSIGPVVSSFIANFRPGGFLSYYHSLYWRHYTLPVFLAVISLSNLFVEKEKLKLSLFLSFLGVYLFGINYLVSVPFEKYGLAVLPIIFILFSYALSEICSKLFEKKAMFIFLLLTIFIVANGNKFTLKPRPFYTLNYDMREIPEVDYKKIYQTIGPRTLALPKGSVALIEETFGIPDYFLGKGYHGYRLSNALPSFSKDAYSGALNITTLDDFKKVYSTYQYGFINFVEHNIRFYPAGLVEFVRQNLDLEYKEDKAWFAPDGDIWPVEVYSWGFTGRNTVATKNK